MAFTQADLDAIDAVIADQRIIGVKKTRMADGREVEYVPMSELMAKRDLIKQSVSTAAATAAGTSGTRATYAKFFKD